MLKQLVCNQKDLKEKVPEVSSNKIVVIAPGVCSDFVFSRMTTVQTALLLFSCFCSVCTLKMLSLQVLP